MLSPALWHQPDLIQGMFQEKAQGRHRASLHMPWALRGNLPLFHTEWGHFKPILHLVTASEVSRTLPSDTNLM